MEAELRLDLWDLARARIRASLGAECVERWFDRVSVLGIEDDEVRLGVRNGFVLDWIRARYLAEITRAWRDVAERDVVVRLSVDPTLYREHRRERDGACEGGASDVPVSRPGALEAPAPGAQPTPAPGGAGGDEGGSQDRDEDRGSDQDAGGGPAGAVAGGTSLGQFVVGPSNEVASSAVLEVLAAPGAVYNPLYVHGGPGRGKTHLLRGVCAALRNGGRVRLPRSDRRSSSGARACRVPPDLVVRYVTGEQFFNHFVASVQDQSAHRFRERYRNLDVLIVDDLQQIVSKKKTQLEFLHTVSALVDSGKQVIVACDKPPRDVVGLDSSLCGRFVGGLVVPIRAPDYSTRLAILRRRTSALEGSIDDAVLQFVAENVRGGAHELIGALMHLDVHARVRGRPVDVHDACQVLADRLREQQRRVTAERVIEAVARHYGVEVSQLVGRSRQRSVSTPRQVAMYLVRKLTGRSLAETGRVFGGRRHTTVQHAVKRLARALEERSSPSLEDVQAIVEGLDSAG